MKFNFLTIVLLSIGVASFAQQKEPILLAAPIQMDNPKVANIASTAQFSNKHNKKRGGSIYLRYVDFLAAQEGLSPLNLQQGLTLSYMFPDSNMRFNPPNQNFGIMSKSIGQVLDPQSSIITTWLNPNDIIIGPTNSYTIDSVWIGGSYAKITPAVDSMKMSLLHSGGNNLPEYFFTGQMANYFVDTVKFLAQFYTPANFNRVHQINYAGGPLPYVSTRALTAQDSSTYLGNNSYTMKYMGFSANNFVVPAGEKVSVSFTFLPGFAWSVGDTIHKNNRYLFTSYEPYGPQTYMPYYPNDRNMSSMVTKDSSNGWSGFYIPTIAFTQPYQQEIHDIFWKITCNTCPNLNPTDLATEDNITSLKLFPNPASNTLNITIELKEKAKDIQFQLTNLVGQTVKHLPLTAKGNTIQTSLDISSLSKGMYLYTLNIDGEKITDKLIIE